MGPCKAPVKDWRDRGSEPSPEQQRKNMLDIDLFKFHQFLHMVTIGHPSQSVNPELGLLGYV